MPFIKAKFTTFEYDEKKFTDKLREEILKRMRFAAREFAKAAAPAVPVRTGFARGVFQNIDDAFGGVGATPLTSGTRLTKKRSGARLSQSKQAGGLRVEYYTGHGGKVLKTPQSGRRYATRTNIVSEKDGKFVFSFNTTITYFNINDFFSNSRTPSAPWHSFELGREAYLKYMRTTGIRSLPKAADFIYRVIIGISEGGLSREVSGTLRKP